MCYTILVSFLYLFAMKENPSFEVIRPLLSRCQLYILKSLGKEDLLELIDRAITTDVELKERKITVKESGALLRYSGGDARKLLNILQLVVESESTNEVVITDKLVQDRLQQNPLSLPLLHQVPSQQPTVLTTEPLQ